MQQLCFLLVSFFGGITALNAQIEPGQIKKEVSDVYQDAEEVEQNLSIDIKIMFDIIDKAIDDANTATKRIQKLAKKKRNGELNEKDEEDVLQMLQNLYSIYERLDNKREILYQQLVTYDDRSDSQIKRVDRLLSKYDNELQKTIHKVNDLQSKIELTKGEQNDLSYFKIDVKNLTTITNRLELFRVKMKEVKRNYSQIDEDVMNFFRNIKNGRRSIGYMMDVVELDRQLESILRTTNDINRLNELSQNIIRSLENLTDSIVELKNASDPEL